MIHANSIKYIERLVYPNQIVSSSILDMICKKIKEVSILNEKSCFIVVSSDKFSKATRQIISLYGYKIESLGWGGYLISWY